MKIAFSSDEIESSVIQKIDVLVLTENCDVDKYKDLNIDVCIFENSNINNLYKLKNIHNAVSCGMGENDSVTFSGISDDSSMVCIRRQIVLENHIIYPCEFKASFCHSLDIYSNLAISLIGHLLQYDV